MVCKGFREGTAGRDPCFVHYCVELFVGFLSWLILVLSVNVSCCDCIVIPCARFAVVHPSVHGNDPDAVRALQKTSLYYIGVEGTNVVWM